MNVRPSLLAGTGSRTIVPTIVAVSLFLLVVGHDAPGGGFVGGLLAGAALLVVFLAQGGRAVSRLLPVDPRTLLGLGIAVAVATAVAGLVAGSALLDAGKLTLDLWALGTFSVGSALVFDVGVYLVVVGLIATFLTELGSAGEKQR
jgi:multisubunit Na+/H+ antiporter MnhB subunit